MWDNRSNKIYEIYIRYMENRIDEIPIKCTICGEKEVHIIFHRWAKNDEKGSGWSWCSACKSFEHGRFLIPDKWENVSELNSEKLTYEPDYLEENKEIIDKYIAFLIKKDVNLLGMNEKINT